MSTRQSVRPGTRPLAEPDIERLQALLDALPAPLAPLGVDMLDGFLCGVLLQPRPVATERWLAYVFDTGGAALPQRLDAKPLRDLVQRRYAELATAIERRNWFDPWVFELEADPSASTSGDNPETVVRATSEAVYPWVAGFVAAMECFPGLMNLHATALFEPLALLYRHLDPSDLEDADELLAVIDALEPPTSLAQAVEELVRATLLLADVSRPRPR